MYASIYFKEEIVAEEVISDIVYLVTGGTNLNDLSSPVDTEYSYITSQILAGWELWDSISETDKIIRSPISDDLTKFKYLRIEQDSDLGSSLLGITIESYRDWDNETHTGTLNIRKNAAGTVMTSNNYLYYRTGSTSETVMNISVSSKHLSAQNMDVYTKRVTGIAMFTEFTRTSFWDTPENGYEPYCITVEPLHTTQWTTPSITAYYRRCPFVRPRIPIDEVDDYDINTSSTSSVKTLTMTFSTMMGSGFNTQNCCGSTTLNHAAYVRAMTDVLKFGSEYLDRNKELKPVIVSFGCHQSFYDNFGGKISEVSGIYMSSSDVTMTGDLMESNGIRYRVWRMPTSIPINYQNTTSNIPVFVVLEA